MKSLKNIIDEFSENPYSALDEFKNLVLDLEYEKKGILFSEIFFLWLLAKNQNPRKILESGRARGQSTLVLSHCFPDSTITSVEHDKNSPDVHISHKRLKDRKNVKELFGDSTKILPAMCEEGDVVLIDGPKGFRGIRLMLKLFSGKKKPAMVFLHDTNVDSLERVFLVKHMPEVLYSDDEKFALHAKNLDHSALDELPEAHKWNNATPPKKGYGFSLACIPYVNRNYRALYIKAIIEGIKIRIFKL